MISDYFKKIETYLGSLTKDEMDSLKNAREQITYGYKNKHYNYDTCIKKWAYAIHYGPIYALQSTVALCNENSLAFFIAQPDEVFIHGCAHFPESYALKRLFSLKKWVLGKSKINLIDRDEDWKPLISKISVIPRQIFKNIDFIKHKLETSKAYSNSKTPFYIYQNCLNEDQNSEIIKAIIDCYKEAPKGAIFLISSIIYSDSRSGPVTFEDFDSTFNDIQNQLVSIGCSKIKKFMDSLTYEPQYPSINCLDFENLTL